MKAERHSLSVLLVALLIAGVRAAAADDTGALLDRVAAAYGGQERLSEVTAYQEYGNTISAIHPHPGQLHRAFQYPDRLRIEIRYGDDDSELRILSGASAWQQGQPVTGALYSAMLLQAARLGLPNTLLDHRDKVRDAGIITDRQGNALRALELPFHGNMRLVVEIDPATGHILESRGIMAGEHGNGMEFVASYDDFRRVEGRLFAFQETHYAMGRQVGHTTLERIEVTGRLPPDLFDGSEPVPALPRPHEARQPYESRMRSVSASGSRCSGNASHARRCSRQDHG